MSIVVLLDELRRREIDVRVVDGDLRCVAPPGSLGPDLREELRRHKDEIIAFFEEARALAAQQPAIVPLQPQGSLTPIFAAPGHNGDVFCYRALVQHLGAEQPFFGLQPPGADPQSEPLDSVEALAAYFVAQIRTFRPAGPYILAGYCAGGVVAYELARQLAAAGATVELVAMFGTRSPRSYRLLAQALAWMRAQPARLRKHVATLASLPWREMRGYLDARYAQRRQRARSYESAMSDAVMARRAKLERTTISAIRDYRPQSYAGRVVHFAPNAEWLNARNKPLHWSPRLAPALEDRCGPGDCDAFTMLREPHAAAFAKLLKTSLA